MISVRQLKKSEMQIGYDIRKIVFVQEQQIPAELEFDDHDDSAWHFIAERDGIPCGYCRVINKNGKGKIGRVAVLSNYRKMGIAQKMIDFVENSLEFKEWIVHSQTYVMPLYLKCGYSAIGDEFIEDGIKHYKMIKQI
eukprot:NODE_170_length_14437_cov_1.447273.p11 type:complete len:138 gc:universal NODE_170_length_14437_cov_1.447273:5114-5527(+)